MSITKLTKPLKPLLVSVLLELETVDEATEQALHRFLNLGNHDTSPAADDLALLLTAVLRVERDDARDHVAATLTLLFVDADPDRSAEGATLAWGIALTVLLVFKAVSSVTADEREARRRGLQFRNATDAELDEQVQMSCHMQLKAALQKHWDICIETLTSSPLRQG